MHPTAAWPAPKCECGEEATVNLNGVLYCNDCAKAPKCESCGGPATHFIQEEGDPSVGYNGGGYWYCEECFAAKGKR